MGRKRKPDLRRRPKKPPPAPNSATLSPEECTALLSDTSHSIVQIHRFLSNSDLLLLPSQLLSLRSYLRLSASLAAKLHSSLSPSIPTLIHPPISNCSSWFLRFSISAASFSDPRWTHFFRMSKQSFDHILQKLSDLLQNPLKGIGGTGDGKNPRPVPPDFKLAAGLFRLAHAAPFAVIAKLFAMESPATAAAAFYQVCHALLTQFGNLIQIPKDTNRECSGIGLPNCVGALGFRRFPTEDGTGGVLMMGVVDWKGRFINVSAGWPGSMSPEEMLRESQLYAKREQFRRLVPEFKLRDDFSVSGYLIGDPCCPNLPWLLTKYSVAKTRLSGKEFAFNSLHDKGMEVAESAFQRLSSTWKLVKERPKIGVIETLSVVVSTACLLHNYVMKCGSEPSEEDGEGLQKVRREFSGEEDEEGEEIRDRLADHVYHNRVKLKKRHLTEVSAGVGRHVSSPPQVRLKSETSLKIRGNGMPSWLYAIFTEDFFAGCSVHDTPRRNDKNVFCLDCSIGICPQCLPAHSDHGLIQVRRYVYHDVVNLEDMEEIVDCSGIQTYINNSSKVIFIKKRPLHKVIKNGKLCPTCQRMVQEPFIYCCLCCKIEYIMKEENDLTPYLRA